MKLPALFIFIPKVGPKATSVDVKASQLTMCEDCKHCYFALNRVLSEQSYACSKLGIDVTPTWFCADGEPKEEK